jgi:hypothetical protein
MKSNFKTKLTGEGKEIIGEYMDNLSEDSSCSSISDFSDNNKNQNPQLSYKNHFISHKRPLPLYSASRKVQKCGLFIMV